MCQTFVWKWLSEQTQWYARSQNVARNQIKEFDALIIYCQQHKASFFNFGKNLKAQSDFETQRRPIKPVMKSAACVCPRHRQKTFHHFFRRLIFFSFRYSRRWDLPSRECPRMLISPRSYFKSPSTSQQPQEKKKKKSRTEVGSMMQITQFKR